MKKGIARLFLFVLLSCLWGGCGNDDEKIPEENEKPVEVPTSTTKALFAYFVADNNLDDDIRKNVTTMCQGLLQMNEPVTLLVYWDGKRSASNRFWNEPCLLKYVTDGKGHLNGRKVHYSAEELAKVHDRSGNAIYYASDTLTWELAEVLPCRYTESTEMSSMTGILNDMFAEVPLATQLGLVLGSHGSGWLKYLDGRNARSFGQDGSQDHTMTTPDMAKAIAATGKHFDFVLFDACMMGCAEVCYDFRQVTDYLIASVLDIPSPGFPYNQLTGDLCSYTKKGYAQACATYIAYYEGLNQSSSGWWGTISLIDCSEMEQLAASIRQKVAGHDHLQSTYSPTHLQQYGGKRSSFRYLSFDVRQFMNELVGDEDADWVEQLNRTIVYKGCVSNVSPHSVYAINPALYSGLGMYIPVDSKNGWNHYFKTLDWYSAAGWNQTYAEWLP